ncbi:hypothetical protein [Bifidobacterium sp. SO4]|uniref:hypothetical protein n=1 Tax=Bifidobacterium sp. SO4 TaxID=2809030 RepID=UPI001BDCC71D|nr:hypothetical protein [Bifidobacterium sp. SO4]MBT1169628.1 hypothetical protein [Bifidobacterium sp. SO4]
MFDELPTYTNEVDLTAMPASLLRLIRSRKHGLWSNKASAELARREADERGIEQAA